MSLQESPSLPAIFGALSTVLAAVLAVVAVALPSSARACTCRELPQREAFAQSTAVFEGRVLSLRVEGATSGGEEGAGEEAAQAPVGGAGVQVVELAVVRTWKGADQERVTLRSPASTAACGFPFEEGESYLIYAQEAQGELRTGLCRRTRRIEEAEEDLAELGAGVTPVDIEDEPLTPAPRRARGDAAGCQSCAVAGAPSSRLRPLAIFGLLAAVASRRLRRRR